MPRPASSEYASFYSGYVDLVPEPEAVSLLHPQLAECEELFATWTEDQWSHRYEPGKWSIRELVGHLADTEWVFASRALWFARGDTTPLPGMDQDDFVRGAHFDSQTGVALAAQFCSLRRATIALFESFDESVLSREGTASDCPFTVRSVSYILVGHVRHHLRVLQERYLD
ncbi:MAG: DinB family protein [Planctomycetota bacterium]